MKDIEKVDALLEEILQHIRKAHFKQFFEKSICLIRMYKINIPHLIDCEDNIIQLESRYNFLCQYLDKGIINLGELEQSNAKIIAASISTTRLIERDIKDYLNNKEEKHSKFEIVTDDAFSPENAKIVSEELKKALEEKIDTKLEVIYTKPGSIIIGFKMPYNLKLMKNLILNANKKLNKNIISIKFNDPLLQSYFDSHLEIKLFVAKKKQSKKLKDLPKKKLFSEPLTTTIKKEVQLSKLQNIDSLSLNPSTIKKLNSLARKIYKVSESKESMLIAKEMVELTYMLRTEESKVVQEHTIKKLGKLLESLTAISLGIEITKEIKSFNEFL